MGGTVETLHALTARLFADQRAAYAAFEAAMIPDSTLPKLYKLRRFDAVSDREDFVTAVVVAPDRETAARIHPRTGRLYGTGPCPCCGMTDPANGGWRDGGWAPTPEQVEVTYLGTAERSRPCPSVVVAATGES